MAPVERASQQCRPHSLSRGSAFPVGVQAQPRGNRWSPSPASFPIRPQGALMGTQLAKSGAGGFRTSP